MQSPDCELTPYQRLVSIWNELTVIKESLPKNQHAALTTVLCQLDPIITAVMSDDLSEPIPLYYVDCQCKVPHAARG